MKKINASPHRGSGAYTWPPGAAGRRGIKLLLQ